MDTVSKKTKIANRIFYIILTLLILGSVGVTFYKIVILKDYQIVAETSCDPVTEKCFVYECSPEDDTECPLPTEERISYYKMVSKQASEIADCELTEEKLGCNEELSCIEGEISCSYTYCDPENLAEGETCAE